MSFGRGMEVYLKPGSKPKISRVTLLMNPDEKAVEKARTMLEKHGLADRISVAEPLYLNDKMITEELEKY